MSLGPSVELQKASLEAKHLKKKLKEKRENQDLLWCRLVDQEFLTTDAERRKGRLAEREADVINQACKIAFSMGFKRCKIIAQAYLPADSVELLQVNFLDESLKVVTANSVEKFTRASRYSAKANKVDAAFQTEEAIGAKEGCSRASHSDNALE